MFNFFKKFNKKDDARELPPNIPEDKGKSIKRINPFYHSSEHQEDEERINKNDPLRNYVPIDEVSSGNEWETYGESSSNSEEDKEEVEDSLELTPNSNEEEMDQAYKNFSDSLQEEPEESINIEAGVTEDELKQKIWDQLIVGNDKNKELSKNPKMDAGIEHKEEKINRKEVRKIQKGMSPEKRVSSRQDDKKDAKKYKYKTTSSKDNFKTMDNKKKERMAREKIAKILDSQQG